MDYIDFVRPSSSKCPDKIQKSEDSNKNSVSGEEVKNFYDSIISNEFAILSNNDTVTKGKAVVETKSKGHRKSRCKKFKVEVPVRKLKMDLMKYCQDCNVEGVKDIFKFKNNFDVNFTDRFGWTPLISAACSGSLPIVKILLKNGASKEVKESGGRSACDIALQMNNCVIANYIHSYDMQEGEPSMNSKFNRVKKLHSCEKCDSHFYDTQEHNLSIIHKVNSYEGFVEKPTHYHIPESNVGFQLLLRNGWNREKGIGLEGQEGNKFPVKTVLKRDKLGFGNKLTSKPRITHQLSYEDSKTRSCRVMNKKSIHKNWKPDILHSMDKEDQNKFIKHFADVEAVAENVLASKQQVVILDKKRNKNREAIRALNKESSPKTWIVCGNLFVKLPKKNVESMLKNDQKEIDLEIDKLRNDIKDNVYKLRDLEGKSELTGFKLKGLSSEELAAMKKTIPYNT